MHNNCTLTAQQGPHFRSNPEFYQTVKKTQREEPITLVNRLHMPKTQTVIRIALFALAAALCPFPKAAAQNGEPGALILGYEPVSGISGNLSSAGSDTLANLMTLWAEQFKRYYPGVNIQIQAAGSSTAPIALTEQTANLGPMSRAMKLNEIRAFQARFGYPPTAIPVALDAVALYVNKDNPLPGLTIAQIDALFSATLRCGEGLAIQRWGQVGLSGGWQERDIQLFGRNSVSGTYGYFKQVALCNGDFRSTVNEQPGSGSVVQSVSASLNGIGYSGIGYRTSSVRAVPVAQGEGGEFVEATMEASIAGRYPLSRYLLIYVNKAPGQPLAPLEREFVRLVLSNDGQQTVAKDGYIPLPDSLIAETLDMLEMR